MDASPTRTSRISVSPTACTGSYADANAHVKIFIGDQADPAFWERILPAIPPLDILIDDGGHSVDQQVATMKATYAHLKPESVYWIEDTHTS